MTTVTTASVLSDKTTHTDARDRTELRLVYMPSDRNSYRWLTAQTNDHGEIEWQDTEISASTAIDALDAAASAWSGSEWDLRGEWTDGSNINWVEPMAASVAA